MYSSRFEISGWYGFLGNTLPAIQFYAVGVSCMHLTNRNPKTTANINFSLQSLHMYTELQKEIFHITLMPAEFNK